MTSEVCLLNRFAAVLAADSATTVSRWDNDRNTTVDRYFKGANKIFQLSAHQPVGLMIYENIALHGVPWEVLVKEFRAHLKGVAHPSPEAYAEAFFGFLRESDWLFPKSVLDEHTNLQGFLAVWSALFGQGVTFKEAQESETKKAQVLATYNARKDALSKSPLPDTFTPQEFETALTSCSPAVADRVKNIAVMLDIDPIELANRPSRV